MTLAIIRDGAAVELAPGADIVFGEELELSPASWATVNLWTEDERNARGVYTVVDAEIDRDHKLGPLAIVVDGDTTAIERQAVALDIDEAAASLAARRSQMKADTMAVRDERIGNGVTFGGHDFQTRPDDRENVQGAAQLAALWLMAGGPADSLRWNGGADDFAWIDADNELRPMSAATVIDFGKAVAAMKSACIFHAFAIKAAIDGAADHAALDAIDINAGWPS